MTETRVLNDEEVKVEVKDSKEKAPETTEEKPSLLKRGLNAGSRCSTALKSIFASIGQMLMGRKKPSWLARATAGFFTVLGWLFFSVAFTPALASGACGIAAYKLTEVDEEAEVETQEEACSEKSSQQ